MEGRFFFITRVPDEPGSLEKAARVITECKGNINRIHYDRRIDPSKPERGFSPIMEARVSSAA